VAFVAMGCFLAGCGSSVSAPPTTAPPPPPTSTGSGPAVTSDCSLKVSVAADAFTGADGTASEIGWQGNQQGVVTCLGGTFLVQDGLYRNYGFGVYNGSSTTWTDVDGYLPAQVTAFGYYGTKVSITEFADRVVLGGAPYVAVYSRVAVSNPTDRVITVDPGASAGLVSLDHPPDAVAPHTTVDHDYVVAADRFGGTYPWPSATTLAAAGGFDRHFQHMQAFWNHQLAAIAAISVPDRSLEDAYRSGFIYTQIAQSGDQLHTGVNGYQAEFSHDVIGILSNLFTQGYFSDAPALLLEARNVMGSSGQYDDGIWTYSVPWAIYLMKTGNLALVRQNFSTDGPNGASQPSIEDTAHAIGASRTSPTGIMAATNDIDTVGYWTTDDFSALLGLAAYRYLAQQVGNTSETAWATQQYDSLLAATNARLEATIHRYHLDYLPCSIVQPNTANRCANPEDANWTSPLGLWAWTGSLLGATLRGPGVSMIDATYAYGFGRLKGRLPADTSGGFPGDYYSTAYNAGNGTAGLASGHHRDQGILGYEFMIANTQSGPYSWWESASAPSTHTPWTGRHPASGQGSSPHAWGMATANDVLLDSLVAERTDGTLIVGRGVPAQWLGGGSPIAVTNFPIQAGQRLSVRITPGHGSVTLTVGGTPPSGPILFQLPSFIDNLASSTTGRIDQATGTVTLRPRTRSVTVRFKTSPTT
jgi:hypothetical protein